MVYYLKSLGDVFIVGFEIVPCLRNCPITLRNCPIKGIVRYLLPTDKAPAPTDRVLTPTDKALTPTDKALTPTDKGLGRIFTSVHSLNVART